MKAFTAGVVVALVLASTPLVAAGDARMQALWVWGTPSRDVVGFAAADGIDTIFVHVPPGDTTDAAIVQFVDLAHRSGISVWALGGDPEWARRIGRWSQWVREVHESGMFDGIIVDVEPYLLEDWKDANARASLMERYLRGVERMEDAAGSSRIMVTVPFWWDSFSEDGVAWLRSVMQSSDGVVVMAYRDHVAGPDGILQAASGEIALAGQVGSIVVLALQADPDAEDGLTFYEEGHGALADARATLLAAFEDERGFGGLSVHRYESYRSRLGEHRVLVSAPNRS